MSGYDEIDGVRISTMLLMLDHNWMRGGPPLIFETMIFGGGDELDGWCDRASNKHAALAMHDRAVALVREHFAARRK